MCKAKKDRGLGFKDLSKVNDAMLAKQVKRLIYDEDFLFFKVFKARYFSNSSIFEAKSSGGSFSWKSIMKARKVIKMGAKWQVRDGKRIRIYGEQWLPSDGEGKVISPTSVLPSDAVVVDLIDPTSGW